MKLSIIGTGAMGTALTQGLLESGEINPKEIFISDPDVERLEKLGKAGVSLASNNIEATEKADILVIAVKPWILDSVIKEILPALNAEKTEVALIVAGIPGEEIKKMFVDNLPQNLSIVIPNTALSVGKSMTFIVKLAGEPNLAIETFGKTGMVKTVEERMLPALTALASCGIAFAMRYVRAAMEGGVELGVKASEGQQIVCQTLAGAIALLSQPHAHPETEIDKVTTPGGITIRGLNAMEKAGFTNAVIEGLRASGK